MRITPKQYAILLYGMTKDASKSTLGESVRQFLKFIISKRDLGQIHKIIRLYKDYWNLKENGGDLEVISAQSLPEASETALKKLFKEKRITIKMTIDPSLIGGILVKLGDTLIDGTIRHRLELLRS